MQIKNCLLNECLVILGTYSNTTAEQHCNTKHTRAQTSPRWSHFLTRQAAEQVCGLVCTYSIPRGLCWCLSKEKGVAGIRKMLPPWYIHWPKGQAGGVHSPAPLHLPLLLWSTRADPWLKPVLRSTHGWPGTGSTAESYFHVLSTSGPCMWGQTTQTAFRTGNSILYLYI